MKEEKKINGIICCTLCAFKSYINFNVDDDDKITDEKN